ncbi:MAG: AraC-like DNA-binding protein [Colwellia sp.]|jgi:AraC-like DNA-binding protein|tara:strand:+ start:22265 stop:22684 length:420 start_codon:yes stop_codon:yes gene_type:complete
MMAKPKPFTPELFEIRVKHAMERLIADKQPLIGEERGDIRVTDIADIFKVNVATFRRWCITYVNQSPSQYLANYRIERAKQLLKQGVKPSKVSEMLAFGEHKIFSTTFKRYQGNTPSEVMKMQFSTYSPNHTASNKKGL